MKQKSDQPSLFGSDPSPPARSARPAPSARSARGEAPLPEGFKYQPELISIDEEQALVREIEKLPLKEFEFHGFTGKRRVVSFGWRYDFNDRQLQKADDMPPFLLPLRAKASAFAGLGATDLQHVLVTWLLERQPDASRRFTRLCLVNALASAVLAAGAILLRGPFEQVLVFRG